MEQTATGPHMFQSHNMMKAVRVHRFGGPEVLTLEQTVPIPEMRDNQVRQNSRRCSPWSRLYPFQR